MQTDPQQQTRTKLQYWRAFLSIFASNGAPVLEFAVLVLGLSFAAIAHAQTLYKSTGPDGKITYTDRPPQDAKTVTELKVQSGPVTPLPESVRKYQEQLKKSMGNRLAAAQAAAAQTPTLFTATWCGQCTRAKAYLNQKNISFREIDIDNEAGAREFISAGGGGGVPFMVGGGNRVVGYDPAAFDAAFGNKKVR
jgi:glutaredoxin